MRVVEAESPHDERHERGRRHVQMCGVSEAAGAEIDGDESWEVEAGGPNAGEAAAGGGEGGEEGESPQEEGAVGEEAAAGEQQRGEEREVVQEEQSAVAADQRRLLALR